MKIKEWIVFGFVFALATASRSLGAPELGILERFEQNEQLAKQLASQIEVHESALLPPTSAWPEIEKFQSSLWRAMALDPTQPILVPPAEVPKSLFAAALNHDLEGKLEELKKSTVARDHGADQEFEQYLQTAAKILKMRGEKHYPEARAIAKRGVLDSQFELLMQKIGKPELKAADSLRSAQHLVRELQKTRETWVNQNKEIERKNIFGGSNQQFAWVMIAVFLGFFLGIAAYRISPDFFQKFLDSTTTPVGPPGLTAQEKLDYNRWLREFEEHLTRLKTSQMSHERRIEEIVGVSEKITQQALSLYADARIKNEGTLESRMSTLLREIQHQFEQGQRLAVGQRAQIHPMLEHCLRLCDAIENGSIQVEKQKSA